jgi:3-hydroxy-9,10-secoandrosta-1,3,5(10)-triene-9,17-dione monooxygenase
VPPQGVSAQLLARAVRDYARVAELTVGAIDTLIALSGTAGFATSSPIQRAWRDIHFASMHIGLNTENNFAHFGRTEFGLPSDPRQPYF